MLNVVGVDCESRLRLVVRAGRTDSGCWQPRRAGRYGEVAQISVELPSKYPAALSVGTPATFINDYY